MRFNTNLDNCGYYGRNFICYTVLIIFRSTSFENDKSFVRSFYFICLIDMDLYKVSNTLFYNQFYWMMFYYVLKPG